ncbi:hypothetical protein GCM10009759_57520 [Kitasatospora saccharophila]|uniref:Uncharacterized protein n=1 Tax=Kitasatospora saccharophila TaxID=407973 RepID=A0ABN2XK40_9ACTN
MVYAGSGRPRPGGALTGDQSRPGARSDPVDELLGVRSRIGPCARRTGAAVEDAKPRAPAVRRSGGGVITRGALTVRIQMREGGL